VNAEGLQELQEITLEEEDYLARGHQLLVAKTRNDAFIENQKKSARPAKQHATRNPTAVNLNIGEVASRRTAETTEIKRALTEKPITTPMLYDGRVAKPLEGPVELNWEEIEKRERSAIIERQRRARK
jgi:hypothetical protein